MQTEEIQSRIQSYTASLTPAVQSGQGAQFSLLLSLISVNQQQYTPAVPVSAVGQTEFRLPEPQYPDPREFYSDALTERLNRAVSGRQRGEFAMLCSYVDTGSRTPRHGRQALDQFEQVALMSSGRLMLERIEQSRQQFATRA